MKILIINEAGIGNLGDDAILLCLQKLLKYKFNNSKLYFQSYSAINTPLFKTNSDVIQDKTKPFLKKILPIFLIKKILWVIENAPTLRKHYKQNYDLVIIGGGALITGYWLFPFVAWFWSFYFKTILKKKIIFFGVSYERNISFWNKKLLKNALSKVDDIYLRSNDSISKIYDDYKIKSKFVPDVVFTLPKFIPASTRIEKKITIFPIGYAIYQYLLSNQNVVPMDYSTYIRFWLDNILSWKNKGFSICLSITDISSDVSILKDIQKELTDLNIIIERKIPKDVVELAEIISSSSTIFSGRMHALIIGYAYGCECITLPISNKLRFFQIEIVESENNNDIFSKSVFDIVEQL